MVRRGGFCGEKGGPQGRRCPLVSAVCSPDDAFAVWVLHRGCGRYGLWPRLCLDILGPEKLFFVNYLTARGRAPGGKSARWCSYSLIHQFSGYKESSRPELGVQRRDVGPTYAGVWLLDQPLGALCRLLLVTLVTSALGGAMGESWVHPCCPACFCTCPGLCVSAAPSAPALVLLSVGVAPGRRQAPGHCPGRLSPAAHRPAAARAGCSRF